MCSRTDFETSQPTETETETEPEGDWLDQSLEMEFDDISPGQDFNPDDAPDGSFQSAYWTDGMTIYRKKFNGKWVYSSGDDV